MSDRVTIRKALIVYANIYALARGPLCRVGDIVSKLFIRNQVDLDRPRLGFVRSDDPGSGSE